MGKRGGGRKEEGGREGEGRKGGRERGREGERVEIVPLQSLMHELDTYFILGKGTV